ncbi:MAG: Rieske 2Fe-2S domain-containing protein [Zetaproteobacteria bacterium]|nr:Rieske 2Fe-2S domain-containing protein [Zetaproteobacteria bacterium]
MLRTLLICGPLWAFFSSAGMAFVAPIYSPITGLGAVVPSAWCVRHARQPQVARNRSLAVTPLVMKDKDAVRPEKKERSQLPVPLIFADELHKNKIIKVSAAALGSLVLFRNENGEVAALHSQCPHKGADLSKGYLKNGHLACGYHGYEFDGKGKCHTPKKQKYCAKPIKVVEQDGLIWLHRAPEMGSRPIGREVHGRMTIQSSYAEVLSNTRDIDHLGVVHAPSLISDPSFQILSECQYNEDGVECNVNLPKRNPMNYILALKGAVMKLRYLPSGTSIHIQGNNGLSAHIELVVREKSKYECELLWRFSRNFAEDAIMGPVVDKVFERECIRTVLEDKNILEDGADT